MKVWANRKFLFCCVLLLTGHTTIAQNFEDCQQVVPPFSWGGIDVDHVMGENVAYSSPDEPFNYLCYNNGSGYIIPLPRVFLGHHDGWCGWNPFIYKLTFSKPINNISFIITHGGHGIDSIDFGAENFVIEAACSAVSIESLFSCNSMILGDTIYVGANIGPNGTGGGSGWFRVNFSQPITSFIISGKGGGCGSDFKICANSMYQAPLWAGVKGEELMCGGGSLFFERYGWLAGPYTYNYNINGGPEQSFVTDEILAETPLTTLFGSEPAPGTHTIELTQITDGSGWAVPLSCNTSHTFTVSNPPLAQFTPSPSTGFAPATITLTNQSQNATQYEWLLNNAPIAPQNNTITLQDTGAYQITLIASNALGCTDTAVQTVHVLEQLQVTIPNVFTPNNDDVNEWFGFTTNVEAEANLVILNRWGGVVFEKSFVTTPNVFEELWDGTSTGSVATPSSVPATDGVYFYKLILSGEDWEETFVGNVSLRR
jgi:gliding motility-associated-like protein